jgi:lipopolysaccharide assembly outer membrane protein LptD (OstA)
MIIAFAALLCVSTTAAYAQDPKPDTVPKTPQERILERLRTLRPVGAPDTIATADTARAQPQNIQMSSGIGGLPTGGLPLGAIGGQGTRDRSNARPAAIERDSIWQKLLTLNGYNATEYKSDTATFRADSSNLQLSGNALVSRDGQELSAGRITYSDSISLACGFDHPRISGGSAAPVESDSLCYDIQNRYGVARGATTTVSEGANWRVYSKTAYTRGDNMYGQSNMFTDCDLPWGQTHYMFTASKIKVERGNMLVARDVTLSFEDVPVFWLPFMVQSMSQGRRSGILMPRFGINDIARTSTRYSRRIEDVGFYWAISDYMGAELAMDWMSDNWTALRASYDYNFLRQFIRGGFTARQFWKDDGGRELTVASQNSWDPNERTHLNANVNFATSSSFIRDRTFDPRELNRSIDSNLSMTRRLNFGSLSLGAARKQFLTDKTVNQTLPNFSFNLSPITLFGALPGEEHWYSNATYTASVSGRREQNLIDDVANTNPTAQSRFTKNGSYQGTFSLGKFGFSQNYTADAQRLDARPIPSKGDSIIMLPGLTTRTNRWNIGIDYQKGLIGTTYIKPELRLGGESLSNAKTDNRVVSAPTRLTFAATMHSDAYGVYDIAAGPFQKFRHKFSPEIVYNYSPKPVADSLQQLAFSSLGSTLENNRIEIRLTQSFEAKYKDDRGGSNAPTIKTDTATADSAGQPRHLDAARTINLLSVTTSAVAYDFVQARDFGTGIGTTTLTNDFHSDLLQSFAVSMEHDLFRKNVREDGGVPTVADRTFAPHLSRVSANMNFSGNSWLFRVLQLGRRDSMPSIPGEPGTSPTQEAEGGVPVNRTQDEFGLVGTRNRYAQTQSTGPTGSWTAALTYQLTRPRDEQALVPENSLYQLNNSDQTMGVTMGFQPTLNWTAHWETRYSFTRGQFNDHLLTLTRRLHDWDANFVFAKAQNGNFSFQFNINLRANPDIKLDWSQNERTNSTFPTR